MRSVWFATFTLMCLLASPAAADQISGTMEKGHNRPGGDYDVIELDRADASECFLACSRMEQCLAWTYVMPGIEGELARCHVKDSVPGASPDPCCTSGVMARAGGLESLATTGLPNAPDPNHPWSQLRDDGQWCTDDILAAGYKPLFVQLSETHDTLYVFTNPAGSGYVGLEGCRQVTWNWAAFNAAWVKETTDYPDPEDDSVYSKTVVYRHLTTGERVTIAYLR